MKFREYVGEKKIIQTSIGPTEENFMKKVLRENSDGSKRNEKEFYFEFEINKKIFKRTFDYIKSWLIRYDVNFIPYHPYLTLYTLKNISSSKKLLENNINKTKDNMIYKPLGTITIKPEEDYDFIILDYIINKEYQNIFENIFISLDIDIVLEHCYVKLFKIKNKFNNRIFEDMMYSCPKMPDLELNDIRLRSKINANL